MMVMVGTVISVTLGMGVCVIEREKKKGGAIPVRPHELDFYLKKMNNHPQKKMLIFGRVGTVVSRKIQRHVNFCRRYL